MIYLAFAFNVLVLAVFAFELHQARRERQQLALLIKSRDVQEFVRAETQLGKPAEEPEVAKPEPKDLEDEDPHKVADLLQGRGTST